MQIQRIQSVYLFLAAVAMAVFTFLPVFSWMNEDGLLTVGALTTCGVTHAMPLLLCLDVLIVVMLLITLFKYRNLSFQLKLCKVNLLLIVTLLVTIGIIFYWQMKQAVNGPQWGWGVALPYVAIVLVLLAHKGIKHDKKLLSDSERIR